MKGRKGKREEGKFGIDSRAYQSNLHSNSLSSDKSESVLSMRTGKSQVDPKTRRKSSWNFPSFQLEFRIAFNLFSSSLFRSILLNNPFCTKVNKFEAIQYKQTAYYSLSNQRTDQLLHFFSFEGEEGRERRLRTEGANPATGMKATEANLRMFVTILAVLGFVPPTLNSTPSCSFFSLRLNDEYPLTFTSSPARARRANNLLFSLALTGPPSFTPTTGGLLGA